MPGARPGPPTKPDPTQDIAHKHRISLYLSAEEVQAMGKQREWTVAELAEEWGLQYGGVRHTIRAAGLEAKVRKVGRAWSVPDDVKRAAEEHRRPRARK